VKEFGFSFEGSDLLTVDNACNGDIEGNASVSDVRSPGGIHCAILH
jgi:hypothetical protein